MIGFRQLFEFLLRTASTMAMFGGLVFCTFAARYLLSIYPDQSVIPPAHVLANAERFLIALQVFFYAVYLIAAAFQVLKGALSAPPGAERSSC